MATDKFDLDLKFGEDLLVTVSVEYPRDKGAFALQGLREVGSEKYIVGLLDALKGDPTIDEVLAQFADEYDDDGDDFEDDDA
jgi:hypothetical protein